MKKYITSESPGFTLIELMIVMAVMAILAILALFGFGKAQASARDVSRSKTIDILRAANERYFGDKGYYPAPGANWDAYIAVLTSGGYLSAAPTDPCGGGAGTAIPSSGTMATCTPTAYGYSQTAGSNYTLILTKESGGTLTFKNPQ